MNSIAFPLTALACLFLISCDNSPSASESETESTTPSQLSSSPAPAGTKPAPDSTPNEKSPQEETASRLTEDTQPSETQLTQQPNSQLSPFTAAQTPQDAKQEPLSSAPAWAEEDPDSPPPADPRQLRIQTKYIEVTHEADSAGIPTAQYQKLFSDEEREEFMRTIAQRKGADIMTAPSMVVPEQQAGRIQIGRQFLYQSDPQDETKFEEVLIGVNSYAKATPSTDGQTTKLQFFTEVKNMDGFKLLDNGLEQPVISTQRLDTTVQLTQGETLILGGLTLNDELVIEDRTPFLSDIPFIGDAFTSSRTEEITRELIVVITPELLPKAE